ncbi:hypothetical protein GBAR_LOCUS29351, partial [Geodia barretti]
MYTPAEIKTSAPSETMRRLIAFIVSLDRYLTLVHAAPLPRPVQGPVVDCFAGGLAAACLTTHFQHVPDLYGVGPQFSLALADRSGNSIDVTTTLISFATSPTWSKICLATDSRTSLTIPGMLCPYITVRSMSRIASRLPASTSIPEALVAASDDRILVTVLTSPPLPMLTTPSIRSATWPAMAAITCPSISVIPGTPLGFSVSNGNAFVVSGLSNWLTISC